MEADYKKDVHTIIDAKKDLFSESAYLVLNQEDFLHNSKAILSYRRNVFEAKVISSKHPSADQHDDPYECLNGSLDLHKNGRQYSIQVENIKDMTHNFSDPCIVIYNFDSLIVDPEKLNQKLKHTSLIEIDEMPSFSAFQVKSVEIGSTLHLRFFSIFMNDVEYHCYCHENKDLNKVYLFIESMDEVYIDDFKESFNTIRYIIAVFNGDWYKGDVFIYSTENSKDKWKGYDSAQYYFDGNSIITGYNICDTLKCSQYLEHIQGTNYKKELCTKVSNEMLSSMSSKIYKNYKIQRVIELLLEATNTNSIVLKTSVFSIALETLANIVLSETKNNLKPIQEEKLVEKIAEKFYSIIDEYESFMTDDAIQIYKKRIQDMNKPANVDRISKSFELLGIRLNKHDHRTLKSRNKYLHGSTPVKNFESDKSKERELRLLAIKFRMLVVMQLTKYLGYKGHIWNHYGEVKAYENRTITEHLIRFV